MVNQAVPILDGLRLRIPVSYIERHAPNLPAYVPISKIPNKSCYNLEGDSFVAEINAAYEETVKWRKNLFLLPIPSGKASKAFIREMTYWLEQFNRDSDFCGIALKVFMLLPNLLLQKPSRNSKAKEHLVKLGERLEIVQTCNGVLHALISLSLCI